jgi:hypothetical protein
MGKYREISKYWIVYAIYVNHRTLSAIENILKFPKKITGKFR